MVYTLTLNPSLDYVMYPSAYLKKGGTNRSDREELRAGGKGINVSVVLKNLDVPTRALGLNTGTHILVKLNNAKPRENNLTTWHF